MKNNRTDKFKQQLFPWPKELKLTGQVFSGKLSLPRCDDGFDHPEELKNLLCAELDCVDSGNIPFLIRKIEHENEQFYRLEISCEGVTVSASGRTGIIWGAMTLRQLWDSDELPGIEICDWPDVENRIGARWTICAETTRSALDFGDGIANFLRRCRELIDFLMRIKVNGVCFEGYRWDTAKFPGFVEAMRELNEYAYNRGVRLIYGGYGIGFGGWGPQMMIAEAHNFLPGIFGDFNRESYPDGEIYECCGNNPNNPQTRCHGTCRSNDEFMTRLIANIADFVRKIQPYAISVHHEDLARAQDVQKVFWDQRCDKCRKRWPDDNFEAFNGAAGAVARGYNAILAGVASVKNGNYDGARDCKVQLLSPGYGDCRDDDDDFKRTVEYWKNLSLQITSDSKVYIGLREQFADGRNELIRETLKQAGDKLQVSSFLVGGADYYTNDAMVTAAPLLCRDLESQYVFNFNGLPEQAVQTVINSEFSWNRRSVWYRLAENETAALRQKICNERYLPSNFTDSSNGLIIAACVAVYGSGAAPAMRELLLLGSNEHCFPALSPYYMFKINRFFRFYQMRRNERREAELACWQQKIRITRQADELLQNILKEHTLPSPHHEILTHTGKLFQIGIKFCEAAALLYEEKVPIQQVSCKLDEIEKLHPVLFGRDFIAPGNGEAELFPEYIASLRELLQTL